MSPVPTRAQPPQLSPSPAKKLTFLTINEPTFTYRYNPQSVVYITVHFSCTLYGLRQMYKDIYPLWWYHIESCHCPKNPLSVHPSLPASSAILCHCFTFSRMSYSWNNTVCRLLIGVFHLVIHIQGYAMSFHSLIVPVFSTA